MKHHLPPFTQPLTKAIEEHDIPALKRIVFVLRFHYAMDYHDICSFAGEATGIAPVTWDHLLSEFEELPT